MDSYDDESGRVGRGERGTGPLTTAYTAVDRPEGSEESTGSPGEAGSPGAFGGQSGIARAGESTGEDAGEGPAGARRPGAGIAALSLPYQVVAAVALAVIGVLACAHVAMIFLHVAPSNTLTKQNGAAIDSWVYPEFEQNWKLFAPNPLQQNISVEARAEIAGPGGGRRTTGWIDLSAEDAAAIRGSLLPSHVEQNELRRGWDFYVNTHNDKNQPNGLRGRLSERYVRRIVMLRLDERALGGKVERIQLRSATRSVEAPPWSQDKIDNRPFYRVAPWWSVTAADLPGGVRNDRTATEAGK